MRVAFKEPHPRVIQDFTLEVYDWVGGDAIASLRACERDYLINYIGENKL